ncbi:MAG: MATE family efflux transporter [Candidatus Methanomethylophilaceae archaeon]
MDEKTKDVEMLLGNPRKAMLAMAIPIIIAMVAQNANNLIDTVWVAGIGTNALSAVGFAFPLFFIIISVGNGIGVGSSSAIARFIGMGDKKSADRTAGQAIILTFVLSLIIGVMMLIFIRPMFEAMGAGIYVEDCISYFSPVLITLPILITGVVMANILRSEGASKRSMYSQILAAVLNIILDPIFIYDFGLGLGLAGAAWATSLSMSISTLLLVYWYFVEKKTYITVDFNRFRLDKELDKAIFRVGLPASMEMIVISVVSMVANIIVTEADPINGVAVYSSTWKIIQVVMIPIMGMGSAVVPVCAAAYGLRRYDNIKEGYKFAIFAITAIMAVILVIVYFAADYIVMLFTYTDSTAVLRGDMAYGLRISCIFIILVPWGFVTAGLFQSLGMGMKSLISTMVRNFIMIPVAGYMVFAYGTLEAFWRGVVISEILGTLFIGLWGLMVLRSLLRERRGDVPSKVVP